MVRKHGAIIISARLYLQSIKEQWHFHWGKKWFKARLVAAPFVFVGYAAVTQPLANYIEQRSGIRLDDGLLASLPNFDCSIAIFCLLYTSLLLFLVLHLDKPLRLVQLLQLHLAIAVVRQICILLVQLEPPSNMIPLKDVFLENTVYPPDINLTKDLFFSGHVASIWLYFLCAENKYLKMYFVLATFLMAFMVLSMRVHYTYDVYGAIFFTTVIYFASTARGYSGVTANIYQSGVVGGLIKKDSEE